MEVGNLVKIEPKIVNGTLLIYFHTQNMEITDLRLFKFLDDAKKLFSDLSTEQIKEFYFIFNIDELNIPANFNLFKDFANFFKQYEDLLMNKLVFTVIQCKNNIFKLFFSLFKKYYVPVKPLYLCSNVEETDLCIFDLEKRKSFPNICNLI